MSKIINLHNSINKYFSNLLETKYLENIILDKNYNVIFDHTINFNGYFVNGLIYNETNEITIKINPYSSESILFITIHEITHVLNKNKLKKLVINYLIQELELIEDDYIVSDELICDIAGVLLGNTKFLNYLYNNSNYNIDINNNYDRFIKNFLINWEYCYRNNIINKYENINYSISLKNININNKTKIPVILSNEKVITTKQNSKRLQQEFKSTITNGVYTNKATGYAAFITSETKGKILKPNGNNTNTKSNNYILRIICALKLPQLFENALYIDTLAPMKNKNQNPNELGYHHFIAPIVIEGNIYRVLITGKEKINSKILYSLNIEILPTKSGTIPRVNKHSLKGVVPTDITISDLIYKVNIFNYQTGKNQQYSSKDIKF